MVRKQTEAMSYGIIGLGRFGSALAATLAEADKELMVLDRSEEKIRQARNYTEHAYVVGFAEGDAAGDGNTKL